jgi:hypothetical protein
VFPACQCEYDIWVWVGWVIFVFFGDDLDDESGHLHIAVMDPEFSALEYAIGDAARFGGERAGDVESACVVRDE